MMIRKTYLLVRVPTSVPEKIEPTVKSPFLTERRKEIRENVISLERKINQNKSKLRLQEFPQVKPLVPEKRVHGRSYSVVKNSLSPLKLRKYVESILDNREARSQRSYRKNHSSMSYVKGVNNYPQKSIYIKSKLIPIFKKRF